MKFVRLFQPRFASLVESGQKTQTVRKTPKRMPRVGDQISLRTWTGKPYRSKQRILGNRVVTNVEPIVIVDGGIFINGMLNAAETGSFAKADGFTGWDEMRAWFQNTHGFPFTGILIQWE